MESRRRSLTGIIVHYRRSLIEGGVVVLAIVGLLGILEILINVFDVPKWLLPSPLSVGLELISNLELLIGHAWVTLIEILVGFLLGLLVGVIFAIFIESSNVLEKVAYPIIITSQTIPVIVIAPLLIIWIGYGIWPKIIVVILMSFFPIVVNMVDGLKSVDPDMVRMLRSLGASRMQVLTKLKLPTSLPFLFSGMRIAITVSVIGAVVGEWVGASSGLGYLMIRSASQFLTDRVFAAILILSAIGVSLFGGIVILERMCIPWHYRNRGSFANNAERGTKFGK